MAEIQDTTPKTEYIKLYFACFVFLIGSVLLSLLVWLPVPKENQAMANLAMGAVLTTIIGVPIAFVLGGNPAKKPTDPTVLNTGDGATNNITKEPTS